MNPPDDADILLDENYYENNSSGETERDRERQRETERDRERQRENGLECVLRFWYDVTAVFL